MTSSDVQHATLQQASLQQAGLQHAAVSPRAAVPPRPAVHTRVPTPPPTQRAAVLTGSAIRLLKRLVTHLPLHRQATFVAHSLPARFWYRAALAIARAQGRLVERMGGNRVLTTELMLDLWLRELSFSGPYPIPCRSNGLEVCLTSGPKLFCWTHLPLTEVPMRLYFEGGGRPVAVVSDEGKIVGENQFQVFGWPERMEALPADAHLLQRVVRTLRSGKSVVFLADHFMGGPLSDVPVRLAGRVGVPLVFQWAELAPDGTLEATYRQAPCPYSRSEAEVAANMTFLRDARARTLSRLGWGTLPQDPAPSERPFTPPPSVD